MRFYFKPTFLFNDQNPRGLPYGRHQCTVFEDHENFGLQFRSSPELCCCSMATLMK